MKLRSDFIAAFLSFFVFVFNFAGTLQEYGLMEELATQQEIQLTEALRSSSGGGGGSGGVSNPKEDTLPSNDDSVIDDVYEEPQLPSLPKRLSVKEDVYFQINGNYNVYNYQFDVAFQAKNLVILEEEHEYLRDDFKIRGLSMDNRRFVDRPEQERNGEVYWIPPLQADDPYYQIFGSANYNLLIYYVWVGDESFRIYSAIPTNDVIRQNIALNEKIGFTIYHPEHEHLTADITIDLIYTPENR